MFFFTGDAMQAQPQKYAKLLRLPVVIEVTGLCRTAIYQLEKAGDFPHRVAIGKRSVAWREDQVIAWIESRQLKAAA